MAYETIQYAVTDGVARVTLNRPDKLNSFTVQMHEELRDALSRIAGDASVRAALLTGAGRGFCAGQDLSDRAVDPNDPSAEPPDLGESLEERYNPLVRAIATLEKPVVCAVNGVAAGAGANVALACDIVLAARSASFIQPFCKLGLVPDSGGTWTLPRLVGLARAKGLALLGDKLPAETAADWGLIWRAVEDDQLMAEAEALAAQLASGPTRGFALIKQAMGESFDHDLDAQLDLERDLQREAGRTEDYREGVSAFMNKRPPAFKGR